MPYFNPMDPGSVNGWRTAVAAGVKRVQRTCPACRRKSLGGTTRFEVERVIVWRCRYCQHEVARAY